MAIPFDDHADAFVDHYASVRGRVRLALLHEQVSAHLPPRASVLDVGGGAGHLARLLARDGHDVVLVDPSRPMRDHAAAVLAAEADDVRARVEVVDGGHADLGSLDRTGRFDAVLCHAVAPYVGDLSDLVAALVPAAAPGGLVSVVVKNRDALAMRPALEGRWDDAVGAFDAVGDAGGLGVRNRAHTRAEVFTALVRHGAEVVDWYGVRVFSDALPYDSDTDVSAVLAAERLAAARDPYRAVARLLHVVARREGAT